MTSERAENILDYGAGSRSTLVNLLRPQGLFYIVNQYLNTMSLTINQSKTDLAYGLKAFKSSSFASITGDFSYQNSSLRLNTSRFCKNKLGEHTVERKPNKSDSPESQTSDRFCGKDHQEEICMSSQNFVY